MSTTSSMLPQRSIGDVAQRELHWVQPHALKRHHELRAGEEVIATLDFERQTFARAVTSSASWTFKREGFWHPQVTVRAPGSEASIAVFRPHWPSGGELTTADGRRYNLKVASFWHSEWVWQIQDQVLVRFKRPVGLFKSDCEVENESDAQALPDLALLILLGWYLMLLYAQDMAIQTAAIGAAAH